MSKEPIKLGLPMKEEVTISEMDAIYMQKPDACDSGTYQELKISTCDGGDGNYFVIQTERWAFNDIDEIIQILKDFKKRIA